MPENLMQSLKNMGNQIYQEKDCQEDISNVWVLKDSMFQFKSIGCIWIVINLFNLIHLLKNILTLRL